MQPGFSEKSPASSMLWHVMLKGSPSELIQTGLPLSSIHANFFKFSSAALQLVKLLG